MSEVGKKFNRRTLFRMKQFYILFNNEKVSTMLTQLTWSHYIQLLPIKDINKLQYYLHLAINQNLDVRSLNNKIKSNEYERLPEETKNKLINKEPVNIKDMIPNPIIINNKNNYDENKEFFLKTMILENMDEFLKQLGDGFTYV